ncbi:MAG TPA: cyclic nucleotide-binding domain-containing protein [Nitriliruptorales bacterium]|nr:cyclic nucleotide-binding domain-containing protein [Nitriliruptorales bacterium]
MARTRTEKLRHLSAVPMFRRLSQRQLQRVARHMDEVQVPAGKVVAREGEIGRELLIVVEGEADVQRGDTTLARIMPGDFFGEMSLIDGKLRSASVVAATDMTLLVVHGREFKPLLDDTPGMKDNIMLALVDRLRNADDRLTM